MASSDFERTTGEPAPSARTGAPGRGPVPAHDLSPATLGTPEHLQSSFTRAAIAADRTDGTWLPHDPGPSAPHDVAATSDRVVAEFRALRAAARASAVAYVRRLRSDGITPEGMLVLVKEATVNHRITGFSAQELTNDIIRWSIEAYFDE